MKIYIVTKSFPKEEVYGLHSQMRRAVSSVPTNISEGCGRNTNAELNRFLVIAAGSLSELQYQLILCKDLRYIDQTIYKELYAEIIQIRKMLHSYSQKLT